MSKKTKEGAIDEIGQDDDWEVLYPGEYLRGADIVGHRPTVKIVRVYRKTIRGKKYPVAELEGKERKWKINFTNGFCLYKMFGPKPKRHWVGRSVTLCTELVDAFGRGPKPAIRVYGSPEIDKEIQVYKDLGGDFGAIRRTMKPTKRNGGPPTSRSPEGANK
jgi:hypothetical protein